MIQRTIGRLGLVAVALGLGAGCQGGGEPAEPGLQASETSTPPPDTYCMCHWWARPWDELIEDRYCTAIEAGDQCNFHRCTVEGPIEVGDCALGASGKYCGCGLGTIEKGLTFVDGSYWLEKDCEKPDTVKFRTVQPGDPMIGEIAWSYLDCAWNPDYEPDEGPIASATEKRAVSDGRVRFVSQPVASECAP